MKSNFLFQQIIITFALKQSHQNIKHYAQIQYYRDVYSKQALYGGHHQ